MKVGVRDVKGFGDAAHPTYFGRQAGELRFGAPDGGARPVNSGHESRYLDLAPLRSRLSLIFLNAGISPATI
jgi:hypothetical protein